jgi:hypothetical protein
LLIAGWSLGRVGERATTLFRAVGFNVALLATLMASQVLMLGVGLLVGEAFLLIRASASTIMMVGK